MVIISSEIILRGFLHRALMLTLIIILWECNRRDTKWYCSQEPDRFAGGGPFAKDLLSRDTALPVKPRLESSTLQLSFISFPCLLFSVVYSHTALELPQDLFAAIHFTLYLCCILSSGQQVLSHPWGRTWEALMRRKWATGSGEQQEVVSTHKKHWSVSCYQQRCFSHTGLKNEASQPYVPGSFPNCLFCSVHLYVCFCANTILFTDEQNKLVAPRGQKDERRGKVSKGDREVQITRYKINWAIKI